MQDDWWIPAILLVLVIIMIAVSSRAEHATLRQMYGTSPELLSIRCACHGDPRMRFSILKNKCYKRTSDGVRQYFDRCGVAS